MKIKKIQDANIRKKTVVLRLDLNVPYSDGQIGDLSRIERAKKTVLFLINSSNKVVILSHFGRPNGKISADLSLRKILVHLEKIMGIKITFFSSFDLEVCQKKIHDAPFPSLFLLENIRYLRHEEKNDPDLSFQLGSLGDIYCNDAFSVSHRAHASTQGITNHLPSFAGFLMQKELTALSNALENPKKPVSAIVGGSKVSTKLDILNNLSDKVDFLIVGGAMANTFLNAQGFDIGTSLVEKKMLGTAKTIIEKLKSSKCRLILPMDVICAQSLKDGVNTEIFKINSCPANKMILDIGPLSQKNIKNIINKSKTLIWNGPLGAFEFQPFDKATNVLAKYVAKNTFEQKLTSIAGGGDTVSALKKSSSDSKFSYVSTAGGAFLEWLEGKTLPGVESLK